MENLTELVFGGSWGNYSLPFWLSDWQKSQLDQVDSEEGIQCLIEMWQNHSPDPNQGSYCNATWDNVYCWAPAPADSVIRKTCFEIFNGTESFAEKLHGYAERICLENGTWKYGIRTNYNACADSFDEMQRKNEEEIYKAVLVQHMLFYGSIVSLLCLFTALTIFYSFRRLWCDRVIVQSHLMFALVLRFIVLVALAEPFVLNRSTSYRDVDAVCKGMVILHLYASVCTFSWMFVQGLYLNHNLTTVSVGTNNREHFTLFYFTGWVLPVILVGIYLVAMLINANPTGCWKGYADMTEMWILLGSIIAALLLNAVFLGNILRILIQKMRRSGAQESSQIITAAKATLVLSPVLGLNNLLLLYNPGGDFQQYYVVINTFCGVSQGFFVSIVYCFINRDVHESIRRCCNRIKSRREANTRSNRVNDRQGRSPPMRMSPIVAQSNCNPPNPGTMESAV